MQISVITDLVALPAKCYYCGGADKSSYLDTGIQIEYYGALIFCNECFNAMAEVYGYISPHKAAAYREVIPRMEQKIQELEAQRQAMELAIEELKKAGYDNPIDEFLHSIRNSLGSDDDSDEDFDSSESGITSGSQRGKKGTAQSSDDERMAELRADSGSLFDFSK